MAENSVLHFLTMNGTRFPFLVVYLVGVVLALTTWQRHPFASLMALIGFLLLTASQILGILFNWYVLREGGFGMGQVGLWMTVSSWAFMVVGVMGWVLILVALFARRQQQEPPWRPDGPERYERRFPESGRPTDSPREDFQR